MQPLSIGLPSAPLLALGLLLCHCGSLGNTTQLAGWDFTRGAKGWTKSPAVARCRRTSEGLVLVGVSEDPSITSPEFRFRSRRFVLVSLRMRSTGDRTGQIFYGSAFTPEKSRTFQVINDGKWHEYRVWLPASAGLGRLRLDPSGGPCICTIASLRVDATTEAPTEAWARPLELRGKKIIGGGQYATSGEEAVTSRFLALHREVIGNFPFDGYVVPVVVGQEWAEGAGLPRRDYLLHELLWSRIRLPYAAVREAIADLNSVRWAHVTDNFLNLTLIDGADGCATPDLADDRDWAVIESNAGLAARLCREAKLQGFWLDTEQYGNYQWRTEAGLPEPGHGRPADLKFPLGKDTPQLLRRRGAQWIKAVQAQMPAVKIITTFAWSPDANGYAPLKGVTAFLNGVLDGIRAPGRLIHGHENTFYFGQGPGTANVANDGRQEGYPGGRARYAEARADIRGWRKYSTNPGKYDRFVSVGMAAWVEDDPWNTWSGWPSGSRWSFWSNLALALAYSDEYVWVWSEHTHYGHGLEAKAGMNPFLASLSNQTFNTGREAAGEFTEEFATDPLRRGWYFDFDMLDIGRKLSPSHDVALMGATSVPYAWSAAARAVRVDGAWPAGPRGDAIPPPDQRRRYVRPIRPVDRRTGFAVSMDFRVTSFGRRSGDRMVIGLFRSGQARSHTGLALEVEAADRAHIVLSGPRGSLRLPLQVQGGIRPGKSYRIAFEYDAARSRLQMSLCDRSAVRRLVSHACAAAPAGMGAFGWDEIGIAHEGGSATGPPRPAYRYLLERASLRRPVPATHGRR